MGLAIDREHFGPEDFARFRVRLSRCLAVLEELLQRPEFGSGVPSLGAELEVALTDPESRPLPLNEEVLRETIDDRITVELNRFNLECNLRHTELKGRPFAHLRRELESARAELGRAAARHDGRVAMVGILPTLMEADLQPEAMTDSARFRALSHALRAAREGPFLLDIAGSDPLQIACDDVTFEGAATSLQIHLRVPPSDFNSVFNAAQLATAPVLAASCNSPIFLSHRLWDETRVALFKQAVDDRGEAARNARRPARVNFGSRWLSGGPIELFREAVEDYAVLLPVLSKQDPDECVADRQIPSLEEIRLHQGTVWHWNRPVYDPHDEGHVRIELRALPAGPTIEDMLANAAFLVGLSLGLAPHMQTLIEESDFEEVEHNFYRAAQQGLDASLAWPRSLGGTSKPESARTILPRLSDLAREGLSRMGVEESDAAPLIDLFMDRVQTGQTGATWQRAALQSFEERMDRRDALARMLDRYQLHSSEGLPVHRWPIP